MNSYTYNHSNGLRRGGGAGVKVKARQRSSNPGPTPFEIDVTRRDTKETWRFCFQSQSVQIEWLSVLKSMVADLNHAYKADGNDDSDDDDVGDSTEGLGANHGFQAGDHIIRWEMLPIIYPIQIHGIVLEAGKNCVIIADFGLASYDNRTSSGGGGGLTTLSEEWKDDSHDVIMAAWDKIKPKEKKRLNVIVVTDPKEIRRWSKISYGDRVEKEEKKEKHGIFTSFLPGSGGKSPSKNKHASKEKAESMTRMEKVKENILSNDDESVENSDANSNYSAPAEEQAGSTLQKEPAEITNDDSVPDAGIQENEVDFLDGEPEWFCAGFRSRKRTDSSSSVKSYTSDGQSVFSIERRADRSKIRALPKSDSAKLVLARTHFILENEGLLPPYHVSSVTKISCFSLVIPWHHLLRMSYLGLTHAGFLQQFRVYSRLV